MARSPASLANCNAQIDTPPVPRSNTLSPGLSPPSTNSEFQAVTPAQGMAVGKSIARLEQRLGVRLFHRTTRTQSLTEDGQAYYERCIRALAELDASAHSGDNNKVISQRLGLWLDFGENAGLLLTLIWKNMQAGQNNFERPSVVCWRTNRVSVALACLKPSKFAGY